MVQAIATTGRKCSEDAVALAKWAAEHAGIPYVPRANLSGKALRERTYRKPPDTVLTMWRF